MYFFNYFIKFIEQGQLSPQRGAGGAQEALDIKEIHRKSEFCEEISEKVEIARLYEAHGVS